LNVVTGATRGLIVAIVKQLTMSAIDGNAAGGELRERILNSPAFSKARAVMLARVVLEGKR
jgi:hypothetical protein